MSALFGLIIVSFFVTSFLLVPFIDLLYFLKRRNKPSKKEVNNTTPIHNQLLAGKDVDTPVGGGILVILAVVILSILTVYLYKHNLDGSIIILIFTVITFGGIGFIDDFRKVAMSFSGKYTGLKGRYILLLQVVFALLISFGLYFGVGFNNIFIPAIGNIVLGFWYIPLAMLAIISFANAYNVSDGLDGLAAGLHLVCMFAFLVLAHSVFNVSLTIFVGVWIGALIAYLYFNVYPARVYLGDAGAYGFGAALAVIGLLTGKILALAIIGGVYVVIISTSLIQIFSKRVLKRKAFPVAPIHMYLKYIGWPEPKIVTRLWLAGAIFAIFGLWLATF